MKTFSIGAMARICNVSIQALRYYDKIDLIKPAIRNPKTNYRYYVIQQVFQINIIKYLQYAKLPIEEIRQVLTLTGDSLANALTKQSRNIDDQIRRLQNSQQLISGQIQQLNDLQQITSHPAGVVYQRHIKERTILQLPAPQRITPLDYPDKETSQLDRLLIENGTIGNLQYGFSFPLRPYQSINDIHYQEILTQVFTHQTPKLQTHLGRIPAGTYLCIFFYWNRQQYFNHYQKLQQAFRHQSAEPSGIVYEISSVNDYSYHDEHDFITELSVKLPEN